ncbi:7154_t:CDS:2, partial [Entrophospora sp. SA101]
MSKGKEFSPTLASQGIIDFNLHYGPFAHHWWHEISTENGSEFYPICLGMTILTELNKLIEESVHNNEIPKVETICNRVSSYSAEMKRDVADK